MYTRNSKQLGGMAIISNYETYRFLLQHRWIDGPVATIINITMMTNSPMMTVKIIPTKLIRGRPLVSVHR
jgi:hypothetical protein